MKYEIETFLDILQGYEKQKDELKNNYTIYKFLKHTFPSKTCAELLDKCIFKDYDIKFLLLLTEIKKENNKKLGVPETPFTF